MLYFWSRRTGQDGEVGGGGDGVCVGGEGRGWGQLSLAFPLLSLRRKGQVFTCERLSR